MNSIINDCINIEKNINDILFINENIRKYNNYDSIEIKFIPEEDGINNFLNAIKNFGKINSFDNNNISKLSSIIKDHLSHEILIINWLSEKVKRKKFKFELIFTMSKNGSNSNDFHRHCDNKGPTLVLVKTTKEKIFGGFTPLSWQIGKGYKYDESNQTFIFSLNLDKKFDMINKANKAIHTDNGPWFGDCDFGLKDNMKKGETYANKTCNFLSNFNLELTGGKGESESFETEDFEVYKVIY